MSTKNILINASNVVAGSNNTKFVYKFLSPQSFTDSAIALNSLNMYFSWYNINAKLYNNNTFQYVWFSSTGVLNVTVNVTLPDGFYSISSINLFLQSVMLANGHYVYDTTTKQNIFFAEFVVNPTYYAFQLNLTPIYPLASVPVGLTRGGTGWQFPTTQRTIQVIINSSNGFKDVIGFNAGSYPPTLTTILYQQLSQNTPNISPCSSVVIRCNMVRNDMANPNDVLYSFTQGNATFGDIINEKPAVMYYSEVQNGTYTELVLTFFDQNYQPMDIKDNQLLMTVIIK
jgi:hypothetical protein